MVHVLAVDLGASGGRVVRGTWDEAARRLSLVEAHRFANEPVSLRGTLHWDFLRLVHEIQTGIRAALRGLPAGDKVACLGFDTWGVDFGLVDGAGRLMANPVHYRDRRTEGQVAALSARLGEGELFRRTGVQDAWFNTVYQLTGALTRDPAALDHAEALLFTPDLLNWAFTGRRAAERTIASTSQLLQAGTSEWDKGLLFELGIPEKLFQPVAEPGTLLGPVDDELAADLGLAPGTPVALVPSHDTEAAALAVPATEPGPFLFLSCGTWSVLGAELTAPVLTEQARVGGFSNEAGFGGTNCLLRNIMGLWLLQESKRWWERTSGPLTWEALTAEAQASPAWGPVIDVTDEVFAGPGDLPGRVADWCRKTGQTAPATRGAVLRCIHESLACEFRRSLEQMEALTGHRFATIWMVGGGTKNRLLLHLTAQLTGRPVTTGPAETTALGNAAAQLIALGVFTNAAEARRAVAESFGTETHTAVPDPEAETFYRRWKGLVGTSGR